MNEGEKKASTSRLFLPALLLLSFATSTLGILTALFLLEMSKTFGVDRGITEQGNTSAPIVSVVFALVMGILSVHFTDRILIALTLTTISPTMKKQRR